MQIVERLSNGSTTVTEILRRRRGNYFVRYDIYLVGKRGWREEVDITQHNLRLRQYTAKKQEQIAEVG